MPELPGGKVDARNTNGRPDLGHASLCTPLCSRLGKTEMQDAQMQMMMMMRRMMMMHLTLAPSEHCATVHCACVCQWPIAIAIDWP